MLDYYSWILKLGILILSGLAVTGAFCSVGWLLSDKELKKEHSLNNILHSKVKKKAHEIESLKAKNYFLLNRVKEEQEKIDSAVEDIERLAVENAELKEKVHNALAFVRSQVDEDGNANNETVEA